MNYILITILLLTDIITYMILIDVIISWVSVFLWAWIKIKFISDILEPIYKFIKKFIPTSFWPIEFAPVILIMVIWLIRWLVSAYDMEIIMTYKDLFKF